MSFISKSFHFRCCLLWVAILVMVTTANAVTPGWSLAVTLSRPPGTVEVAREDYQTTVTATVLTAPSTDLNCVVDAPGWVWSARVTNGPPGFRPESYAEVNPLDYGHMGCDAEVGLFFPTPGRYRVWVWATAFYPSSCEVHPIPVSGGISFEVHVFRKIWSGSGIVAKSGQPPRMLAPVHESEGQNGKAPLVVEVGDELRCEVEAATQTGKWTLGSETGAEPDPVTYQWTLEGGEDDAGGGFASSGARATVWKAPRTPGRYLLTCTIADRWSPVGPGIEENEGGSRYARPVRIGVPVVVYALTLEMRRSPVAGLITPAYGRWVEIAAGAVDTPIHCADIWVKVTPPIAGIRLGKDDLIYSSGSPEPIPGSVPAQIEWFGPSDSKGDIRGKLVSTNVETFYTAELKHGHEDPPPFVSIEQFWSHGDPNHWAYDENFQFGVARPVTHWLEHEDGGCVAPITGHTVQFRVLQEDGYQWDSQSGSYVPSVWEDNQPTFDTDAGPDVQVTQVKNASEFQSFFGPNRALASKVRDTGLNGRFTENLTTPYDPKRVVTSVDFQALDLSVILPPE